jgi:NADPH:quinone reductase-like Zn-dependent oxidoreductase
MIPSTALELRSLVKPNGELELSLAEVPVPAPGPREVLVRVEAAPINPSDLGLLLGPADLDTLQFSGSAQRPVVTARVPETALRGLAGRVGSSMPVGNEAAGVVVATGDSEAARALQGRTVALIGGAMFTQYRCVGVDSCLPLPEGTSAVQGCAAFVNPLTALGMVETMRREGHTALVHTAAASNLGQMLVRLCQEENVGLVNIVRSAPQAALLRGLGARHVVDSSEAEFLPRLTEALAATGATIAFDAIGGGKLAGRILNCMEAVASRNAREYSRYGSSVRKQVYLYGSLDTGPTELTRNFGFTWSVGGWLLFNFLQKIGPEAARALNRRVLAGLATTFASHFTAEVSLAGALESAALAAYARRSTGAKYYINPSR